MPAETDPDTAEAVAADAAGSLFHTSPFLEQLLVQLLVPVTVIYLLIAHGTASAANVLSFPRPFSCVFALIFATAQLVSALPLAILCAWTLRGAAGNAANTSSTAILRCEIVSMSAVLLMHRLAIAIKYAFQPTALYARRMSVWVTYQERLDDQLFASWFTLSQATIDREVAAAVAAVGEAEAQAAYTLLPNSLSSLRAGLHEEAAAALPPPHSLTLTASALATALLLQVNKATSGYVLALQRATTVAGLLSTFSTTILRSVLSLPILGTSRLEALIIIGSWVCNLLLLPTIFTFLAVGIVDHARRERALEALSRLHRPSHKAGAGGASGSAGAAAGTAGSGLLALALDPPLLPLVSVGDARAFLATRTLLLSFGAGFHARLVTVISADLIVIFGVAAFCVYSALTSPTSSVDGTAAPILAPLVLHHALVVPAIALCALGLTAAARANAAAAAGATVVAEARLLQRVASHEAEAPPPALLPLLEDVERLLREHAVPVTILGLAATQALANTLVGGVFSVETLLVSGSATRLNGPPTGRVEALTVNATAALPGDGEPELSLQAGVGYFFAGLSGAALVAACVVLVARQQRQQLKAVTSEAIKAALLRTEGQQQGQKQHSPPSVKAVLQRAEQGRPPGTVDNPMRVAAAAAAAAAAASSASEAPLPAGWVQHSDSGDTWYENTATREVQWDRPA